MSVEPAELAIAEALLKAVASAPARRFERRERIGEGGGGTVDILFDKLLQRPSAIKTLLRSARVQPLLARAFLREAQITAQLDHPNLVPVYDVGVDEEDRFYFTMKKVEGRTLDELVQTYRGEHHHVHRAFELQVDMLDVLVKVCDALAFAHSRGVIHCDLKAQNIMVGDFGQVYLMDWGFAQLLPPPADLETRRRWVTDPLPRLPGASTEGLVFGTPAYMSPEQANGLTDTLDERTDVFSLGALLYQVVSGRVPYEADSAMEAVQLAQECDYVPLMPTPDGSVGLRPKELVRIARRAMSRLPDQRYATANAFKADLTRYLRGGSQFPTRVVPAGAVILREGEEAAEAFIIGSGECEVFKTVSGEKVSLQILGPGEVFGEIALLTAARRNANVSALTQVTLMVVTRDVLDQEMTTMKPWMGALVRSLAARFRAAQERHLARSEASEPPLDEGTEDDVDLWSGFK